MVSAFIFCFLINQYEDPPTLSNLSFNFIKPRLGEFAWLIILIGVIMFDADHFDTLAVATLSPLTGPGLNLKIKYPL